MAEAFQEVPLLAWQGAHLTFPNGRQALGGVSLTVRAGEFVALLGPSGCGKSTLLRLAAGLLAPTAGTVEVAGRPPAQEVGRLAFLFQEPTLLPWLTAAENAALLLQLRGVPAAERRARAAEALALVGLADAGHLRPRELSGGMQMRVAIARALVLRPELLLLDEPFGALDEINRDRLNDELMRLRERDRWTAVCVTHSVAEAVFLASRVVVMAANPGRVAAVLENPEPFPRPPEYRQSDRAFALAREVSAALRAASAA